MKVSFTILGEPASKANSRQIVKFGERQAVIKSQKPSHHARRVRLDSQSDEARVRATRA